MVNSRNTAVNWVNTYDPMRVRVERPNKNNTKVHLYIVNNGKNVAHLEVNLPNNRTNSVEYSGGTHPNYRGRGYGAVIRALATKMAQIANYKKVSHFGQNINNKSKKRGGPNAGLASSTYIVRKVLGYRQNGPYKHWSLFEFNKNSMNKVNGLLRNWKKTSATLPKPSSKRA